MRERRTGVWEIRVVVANDQLTGHSVQRSFTVHGDREMAEDSLPESDFPSALRRSTP